VIVRSPPAPAALAVSAAARPAAAPEAPGRRGALDPVVLAAPLSGAANAVVQPGATAGARGDGGAANGAPIVE
jgi:hypothetical protein